MDMERIFLGWDKPLCETVPAHLLKQAGKGLLDLRNTVVVVPTRQSSWRLKAALPMAADARGTVTLGPEIVTPPVLLEPPAHAGVASASQSLLAWTSVLKAVETDGFAAFLGARDNRPSGTAWALQIARRLQDLRCELADGGWTLARVAALGPELEECERWADMGALEDRFLRQLADWNLRDAHTVKLAFAATGQPPPELRRIVVAAVPDPPKLLETLLERWAASGTAVEILIAAPASEAAAFDAWGRPLPDCWAKREIALRTEDLWLEATPADQAGSIARRVAEALTAQPDSAPARPQLAIGVPDREAVAPLQRELAAIGLSTFDPQNKPFSQTPLFRLVQALLALRANAGYAETAALLRHPDVVRVLGRGADLLRDLDAFQAEYLPVTLDDLYEREATDPKRAPPPPPLAAVEQVRRWRGLLMQGDLASALRAVLQQIFAQRTLESGNPDDAAFQLSVAAFDTAVRELESAVRAGYTGNDAAEVLLARLGEITVKAERQRELLDLEGWLELAWNPAPLLFVSGMNEGCVPDGHVGDLFLPDSLRTKLGLRDDRLRLARDAYVLTALLEQRRAEGRVILLIGKTATSGDPLRPSRLLFRCRDDALVDRAKRLFRELQPSLTSAAFSIGFKLDPSLIPSGCLNQKRSSELSPTIFRDYLACPLRFYLRHVLDMKPADDRAREPDALAFGTVVHAALDDMANDKGLWACRDADRLANWLEQQVRRRAEARYGKRPWLGVDLALDSAVRRLRAFAQKQVQWHAEGWEIFEHERKKVCTIGGMTIQGRIDRIDRNAKDGRYCVLDYKTTDKAKAPREAHCGSLRENEDLLAAVIPAALASAKKGAKDKRWADLQLPLYREFVKGTCGSDVLLGYVCLPSALGETTFAVWTDYTDGLHASAIGCAEAVVERIKNGVFWPAGKINAAYTDDFSGLLLGDPLKTVTPPASPWRATP